MALEELEVEAWQFRELSRHPETAPFLHALKIILSVHSSFLYFHHANRYIIAKNQNRCFRCFCSYAGYAAKRHPSGCRAVVSKSSHENHKNSPLKIRIYLHFHLLICNFVRKVDFLQKNIPTMKRIIPLLLMLTLTTGAYAQIEQTEDTDNTSIDMLDNEEEAPSYDEKIFELAQAGDPEAQLTLAKTFDFGKPEQINKEEAVKWYLAAAEQDNAEAQYLLSTHFFRGDGIERSLSQAVKWCRRSAQLGDDRAQYSMGVCHANGLGVTKSILDAVQWWRMAADQGNADAQCEMGVYCSTDEQDPEATPEKAVEWWRMAAEQGHARAQAFLGKSYYDGKGVKKSYTEAVKWYRLSVQKGNATAQNNLGVCYLHGQGVEANEAEAVRLFRLSAKQGHRLAKHNLEALGK